ncbi:unnamed protein product [Caenorhabditis bovis]|uniref:Uncharacterized protein n=1 Tax=Caenorhabditis bovis TaxID=2654633 RepID=A0A8S1EDN5_9PELO|nr:unnamed protein product [Caenorhabditis bovis]
MLTLGDPKAPRKKFTFNVGAVSLPDVPMVLAGTYDLELMDASVELPSLAALYPQSSFDSFNLIVQPIEYCMAVYLCPIERNINSPNESRVHIHQEACQTDGAVKIYPWEHKILVHDGKGFQSFVYLDPITTFIQHRDSEQAYVLNLKKGDVDTYAQFYAAKPIEVLVNYTNMDLLLLTNGRDCHASIQSSNGQNAFYQIFGPQTLDPQSHKKLPAVIFNGKTLIPTLYDPLRDDITKTFDLFPKLATMKIKYLDTEKCTSGGFREQPPFLTNKRSGTSQDVLVETIKSTTDTFTSFAIEARECAWARVWIGKKGDKMTNYKPVGEDFLDISYESSFIIPFHTDEAEITNLAPDMMSRIIVKVHTASPKSLVEIGVGGSGRSSLFTYYTANKKLHLSEFSVHLIRAPRCDAQIVSTTQNALAYRKKAASNRLNLAKCSYFVEN